MVGPCECCVLSGRGIYDELVTLPVEFYQVWCVCVISKSQQQGGQGPSGNVAPQGKKLYIYKLCVCIYIYYLLIYLLTYAYSIEQSS